MTHASTGTPDRQLANQHECSTITSHPVGLDNVPVPIIVQSFVHTRAPRHDAPRIVVGLAEASAMWTCMKLGLQMMPATLPRQLADKVSCGVESTARV